LFLSDWLALAIALVLAIGLASSARIPLGAWWPRLTTTNLFVLMIVLVTPWSVPGEPLVIVGSAHYTREGAALVGQIALRANIIAIVLTAFLATMEPMTVGHALQRLKLPNRLALLMMFTVRYIEVFEREYLRLRQAMRVRGFQAGMNRHTLRTFGNLIGMLLVHAFDRSERVRQAMICRGFTGQFHTHRHMRAARADWVFTAGVVAALVTLGFVQWA
jgi:cobalt/nickel transport system permease protein